MSRYEKGANFERQVVEKFQKEGWLALRAAGSGTINFVIPDVAAIKGEKIILIECKTTRKKRISLKNAILSLKEIVGISPRAQIFLAVKFFRKKPRFYLLENLLQKDNFTISLEDEYLTFKDVLAL